MTSSLFINSPISSEIPIMGPHTKNYFYKIMHPDVKIGYQPLPVGWCQSISRLLYLMF